MAALGRALAAPTCRLKDLDLGHNAAVGSRAYRGVDVESHCLRAGRFPDLRSPEIINLTAGSRALMKALIRLEIED
jgi:hypothetical protein